MKQQSVSENSVRVARNTLMLYFRMLLLMFIGLFTSRVILKTLGVADYDVYGTVGSIVTAFTVVTAAISQAISRYITFELGRGDDEKLRKIFSTSVIIQLLFCLIILLLTETAGLWYLNHKVVLPEGRLDAARWVLQCSMGVLMVNLLSVPFNAVITAHEKMKAYAYRSCTWERLIMNLPKVPVFVRTKILPGTSEMFSRETGHQVCYTFRTLWDTKNR